MNCFIRHPVIQCIYLLTAGEIPELSERHFALNKDDEFTVTHPIAFSMLGETKLNW